MMRRFFLFLSEQRGIRRWMETSSVSRKFTKRFIAGETLEQALGVSASLERQGIQSTLDHLGEKVTSLEEATRSCDACLDALREIAARRLPATVSIKLTQFGLDLGEQVCFDLVQRLLEPARTLKTP